ncbi:mucin-2-like [Scylla paramamosain]|uniref:mucin-2-like n=1 Tax=Scylla paramamosain TaxID=85552 RepID=UPI003082F3BB
MDRRWALSLLVPGFRFAHEVQQPSVGNYFGHSSQGKAGRTEGRYYVFLPDGRLMTVSYYADNTGYHPSISYSDVKDANDLSAKDILKRRGGTTSANSRTTSGASETSSTTSLGATKDSNQDILQSEGSTTPGSPGTTPRSSGTTSATNSDTQQDFNQDILQRGGGTTLGNPRTTSGSSDTTPVRSDTTPTTSRGATKDSNQGILQGRGSTTFRNSGTTPVTSSTTFGTSLDIQKDSTQDILQRRGSTTFRNTSTTSRTSGTTPTTSVGTVKDSRAEILRRNEARRYSILQKSPKVSLSSGSRQQDLPRQGILQTEGDTSLRNPVVSPTVPLTTQRTPEAPAKDTEPRRGRLLARNPGNEKREGNGGVLQGEARPLSTAPRDRLGAATVEAPSLLAKVLANGNQAQSPPANRVTRTLRPEVYISGDSDNALPVSSWAAKGEHVTSKPITGRPFSPVSSQPITGPLVTTFRPISTQHFNPTTYHPIIPVSVPTVAPITLQAPISSRPIRFQNSKTLITSQPMKKQHSNPTQITEPMKTHQKTSKNSPPIGAQRPKTPKISQPIISKHSKPAPVSQPIKKPGMGAPFIPFLPTGAIPIAFPGSEFALNARDHFPYYHHYNHHYYDTKYDHNTHKDSRHTQTSSSYYHGSEN